MHGKELVLKPLPKDIQTKSLRTGLHKHDWNFRTDSRQGLEADYSLALAWYKSEINLNITQKKEKL